MKARNEEGTIKFYLEIPGKYRSETINIAGGFHKLPTVIHEQEGFYDVITPEIDYEIHELGAIYFDSDAKVFKYPVEELVLDLEAIREEKHRVFQQILEQEMTPALMFGVLEKLAMGEPIPQETTAAISALRTREAQVKANIDAITDPVLMKRFGFDPVEITQSTELLKGGRKL